MDNLAVWPITLDILLWTKVVDGPTPLPPVHCGTKIPHRRTKQTSKVRKGPNCGLHWLLHHYKNRAFRLVRNWKLWAPLKLCQCLWIFSTEMTRESTVENTYRGHNKCPAMWDMATCKVRKIAIVSVACVSVPWIMFYGEYYNVCPESPFTSPGWNRPLLCVLYFIFLFCLLFYTS